MSLTWLLLRAGGWPRMLLAAISTAFVSTLLLVSVAVLRLPGEPQEYLFELVASSGTRSGTVLAMVLLTVPALLLLDQVVRLGTAARERRLAALRVAGATIGEVSWWGALEVAIPSCAGAVGGLGLYGVARALFGGSQLLGPDVLGVPGVHLVPTTVAPLWWQVLIIVLALTLLGFGVGWRASRRVLDDPLAVVRRQRRRAPRPWGWLLLLPALVFGGLIFGGSVSDYVSDDAQNAVTLVVLGLAVISMMTVAPWLTYRVAHLVAARSSSVAMLLATARLLGDPRAAGRAAAAVGGIALVAGGAGGIVADLIALSMVEAFYVISLLLLAVVLLLALLVVVGTLAVHSVENLLDRKRETAVLVALGTPVEELELSQRYEAALAAIPTAVIGALLGAVGVSGLLISSEQDATAALVSVVVSLVTIAATVLLVWLAIKIAVRLVRHWFLASTAPTNLRTE